MCLNRPIRKCTKIPVGADAYIGPEYQRYDERNRTQHLRKTVSLRASAHTGVAISRFFNNGAFTSIQGIATPECGLVRDDIRFQWLFNMQSVADKQLSCRELIEQDG